MPLSFHKIQNKMNEKKNEQKPHTAKPMPRRIKKKFTAIKYKNKNEIKIINRHASSAQNHLFIFHFRVAFLLLLLHG